MRCNSSFPSPNGAALVRTSANDVRTETRRYDACGGLSVAADVGGHPSHPAVILLHGGGQTRHSWAGAMRELLVQGYHVINLDARGHGNSDWAKDGDYGLEALAADLHAVIGTLPSKPALVGASMGGATALYLAGNDRESLVTAIVMVDVVPRLSPEGVAKITHFMRARPEGFASLEEAAAAVAAYNPHRPRPKDVTGLMKNLRRRADGRLHWHWDPAFARSPQSPEPPQFTDLLLRAAAHVRIPTLLVRGMESDIVAPEAVSELRLHLPGLEVFDVAGAGHMVAGDKNDAFNCGVIDFLQRYLPVK
jgi:pimeloyl-ACP methyl ester carboxylesterase